MGGDQNLISKLKGINLNKALKQLEKLKQQEAALKSKMQLAESKYKAQSRKDDTRRKILRGAYFLEKNKKENTEKELIEQILPTLKRESDKQLLLEYLHHTETF